MYNVAFVYDVSLSIVSLVSTDKINNVFMYSGYMAEQYKGS